MNSTALQIYSFLMREEIQFTRFCHPVYQNQVQWKQFFQKSKLDVFFPICTVFRKQHEKGFVLYLHDAQTSCPASSEYAAASEADMEQLCTILQCDRNTFSPLGILFDKVLLCEVQIDASLSMKKPWCFSPCSNASSVILLPDVFLHQFLPAASHPLCLNKATA